MFAFSHEKCFQCTHRPVSIVSGWVTIRTTQVLVTNPIATHTRVITNRTLPHSNRRMTSEALIKRKKNIHNIYNKEIKKNIDSALYAM